MGRAGLTSTPEVLIREGGCSSSGLLVASWQRTLFIMEKIDPWFMLSLMTRATLPENALHTQKLSNKCSSSVTLDKEEQVLSLKGKLKLPA